MRFFTLATVILLSCLALRAQTDDVGKSTHKTPRPKPSTPVKPKVVKPRPAPATKGSGKPVKAPIRPTSASLTISVTEAEAEIFLLDKEGNTAFDVDSQITAAENEPFLVESLKAGSYELVVRKSGYSEYRSQLSIAAGKANNVSVRLKATSAFLTISGSIDGATIEIEGVGSFQGALTRFQLNPGKYNITIKKVGYLIDKRVVDLAFVGQEVTLIPILNQIPISDMIAEAQLALNNSNNDRAVELGTQILEIEPGNGKANLIIGMAYFKSERREGTPFFIAAIRSGQTVSLPVRIFNKDKRLQLPEGEITVDRNILYLRSAGRDNLNFAVSKQNVSKLTIKTDDKNISYVMLEGTGDVNGKKADRTIRLYPLRVLITADGKSTFCSGKSGSNCSLETESLYDLIVQWQSGLR